MQFFLICQHTICAPFNAKGKSLAAWNKVCKPKAKGGLGVINLRQQNKALLMKNLRKFYNKHDLPWVQLTWNTHYNGLVPHELERNDLFGGRIYSDFAHITAELRLVKWEMVQLFYFGMISGMALCFHSNILGSVHLQIKNR